MKEKITVCFILFTLFSFPIISFMKKKETISITERRELATFPKDDLLNFEKWEDYLTDHFLGREELKKIKGFISLDILQKKENKNTVQIEDSLYDLAFSINEKSVINITNLINKIIKEYIRSNNIYYSIIPDKNYYLKENQLPKLNYEQLEKMLKDNIKNATYINIVNNLNLNSYYKTDIHWKQTEILNVANQILQEIQNEVQEINYKKQEKYPFYGVLKSRIPNNIEAEKIEYVTNQTIQNSTVYNYEKKQIQTVYNENYQDLKDGYDLFLHGATPLLIIENKNTQSEKELIIFRDSFASSLAPLLIENYKKITLIDLRYINSNMLDKIAELSWNEEQDILFLYSIPVINNSFTLK